MNIQQTYYQIVLTLSIMDPNPRIPEHSKHFLNFYNDMAMHYCQIPSQLLSTAMHMARNPAWLHGLHLLGFV